eukprot:Lankesteria_metandrocarpae@DN4032_c0_g1_i4.p2
MATAEPEQQVAIKWADIEDDDDINFGGEEITIDKGDGLEEKIRYFQNDIEQKLKTVRLVRQIKHQTSVNRAVFKRDLWTGLEAGADPNEQDLGIKEDDNELLFDLARTGGFKVDGANDDQYEDGDRAASLQQLRPDMKKKFNALMKAVNEETVQTSGVAPAVAAPQAAVEKKGEVIYKAPWMLKQEAGIQLRTADERHHDESTVRVTNLSEDADESDLFRLFGGVGGVHRVFLAKNRDSGQSKGFAFVTFKNKEDAQKAVTQLNRHGYDNLLISVEPAKQPYRDRQNRDNPRP